MLERPSVALLTWQHLLYRRLSGQHAAIPTSASTEAAETGLGIGRNAYWYVGRVEPDFGQVVCIHAVDTSAGVNATVSPFDTGGLWHGHVRTDPALDNTQRSALVAATGHNLSGYDAPMTRWLAAAFDAPPTGYASGTAPSVASVAAITLGAPNQARSWTWEARVPSVTDVRAAAPVEALYITAADRDSYLQWVIAEAPISRTDRSNHARLLHRVARVSAAPCADALLSLAAAA